MARALIFHMYIPCDKTYPLVPLFFTLWPWPWSLTHFLKTLTLRHVITFEQCVLELWYFTWIFLVLRPFREYQHFWPCDLDPGVWPVFICNINLAINFWTMNARVLMFHMNIPSDKALRWIPTILTFWSWSLNYFLKTLALFRTF